MTLRIAKAVRTCRAMPSQWDAWTDDGRYLYLRYRFGIGTVRADRADGPVLAEFGAQSWDGDIDLPEFCERARLTLTPEAEVAGEPEG